MTADLLGPFELSFDAVDAMQGSAAGVFAVGYLDGSGRFRIERIGRDDRDLKGCLQSMIGSGSRFKYARTRSARDAFVAECELFHKFRPPGNISHPARPSGSDWVCPACLRSPAAR